MRTFIACAFACAALALLVRPASAETLRCGSVLIEPGDDARYVLQNCGEPDSSPGPAHSMPARGFVNYTAGVFHAARWRYQRGPGKFPVVLTIGDDGRVANIQFEKHRE